MAFVAFSYRTGGVFINIVSVLDSVVPMLAMQYYCERLPVASVLLESFFFIVYLVWALAVGLLKIAFISSTFEGRGTRRRRSASPDNFLRAGLVSLQSSLRSSQSSCRIAIFASRSIMQIGSTLNLEFHRCARRRAGGCPIEIFINKNKIGAFCYFIYWFLIGKVGQLDVYYIIKKSGLLISFGLIHLLIYLS